uniref:UBX domain-containing protein n=1 Tax=Angiostrongylus cantonensis TaxID=6313 RepID=A0A0K0DKX0_ANGCA
MPQLPYGFFTGCENKEFQDGLRFLDTSVQLSREAGMKGEHLNNCDDQESGKSHTKGSIGYLLPHIVPFTTVFYAVKNPFSSFMSINEEFEISLDQLVLHIDDEAVDD